MKLLNKLLKYQAVCVCVYVCGALLFIQTLFGQKKKKKLAFIYNFFYFFKR